MEEEREGRRAGPGRAHLGQFLPALTDLHSGPATIFRLPSGPFASRLDPIDTLGRLQGRAPNVEPLYRAAFLLIKVKKSTNSTQT